MQPKLESLPHAGCSAPPAAALDLHAVQPAQLNIFIKAAQLRSFSEAARRLGLTQSAVSQAVARLERELRITLIDRSGRPPQLTDAGRQVLALSQDVVSASQHFLRAVESVQTGQIRTLRFGITESAASYASSELEAALIPLVENFDAQWGLIAKTLKDFHDGKLDVAVAPDIPVDDRLLAERLVTECYLIVHPRTDSIDADLLPLSALRAHLTLPFISNRRESLDWRRAQAMLRILGISVHRRVVVESTQSVTNAVTRGLGWTILPPTSLWCVREQLENITVHSTGEARIEKTLWAAARTTSYLPIVERISALYREMLERRWLPELTSRKPILSKFMAVGTDAGEAR